MFIKLAIGLVIGSATVATLAQTITDIQARPGASAYAQNDANVIVRNPYGLCWRSGYWTPSDAVPGCDGQLAPPVAKITAPAIPAFPPAAPAPSVAASLTPKRCDFTATMENDQTFAFNKAVLSGSARRFIDEEVVRKLATCARIENVVITGHTDRIGTAAYNQKLSEKRAEAVTAYLKSRNTALVIRTIGSGSTQPITVCDKMEDRQKLITCLAPNRRVTIEVNGVTN